MKVSEFDYKLPEELIAAHPIEKRDESRLLVLNKENGKIFISKRHQSGASKRRSGRTQ